MNFTVNGGYTMSLLNETYGPSLFYGMCTLIVVVCMWYFGNMGWITPINFPRRVRNLFSCLIPEGSIYSDVGSSASAQPKSVAVDEEQARYTEASGFFGRRNADEIADIEELKRTEIAHTKRSLMSMPTKERISVVADPNRLRTRRYDGISSPSEVRAKRANTDI